MQCLVLVKFLEGGSISPEEFFTRIGAQWSWVDYVPPEPTTKAGGKGPVHPPKIRNAMCIADYDSVEQLTTDLSIMPGAGISGVEIHPIYKTHELAETQDLSLA
jgi:hypothetical protein